MGYLFERLSPMCHLFDVIPRRHHPLSGRALRAVARVTAILATGVTGVFGGAASAQLPHWSALVQAPAGSIAHYACPSGANAVDSIAVAQSFVRHSSGDVLAVSCPAGTPGSVVYNGSTALAVERLSGATGATLWRREFLAPEVIYFSGFRNFIALDAAGDVYVASTVLSDEYNPFTHVLKYAGTTDQPVWQKLVMAPIDEMEVLTSGHVRLSSGSPATFLLGSTGVETTFVGASPLPDRGGVPVVGSGVAYVALVSANQVRRIEKYLNVGPPGVPVITGSFTSNDVISMSFQPPDDGGSPILDYRMTCEDGGGYGWQPVRTYATSPAILQVVSEDNPTFFEGFPVTCILKARNIFGYGPATVPRVFNSTYVAYSLVNAVSRKAHGAAGSFDLPLKRGFAQSGAVAVEPRAQGSGHVIVFQFNYFLYGSVSGLSLTVGSMPAVPLTSYNVSGNELRVQLPSTIANGSRVTISGTVAGSLPFAESLAFLQGDIDQSGTVEAIDASRVRARSGQRASLENFLFDLNASGAITAADHLFARAQIGRTLNN